MDKRILLGAIVIIILVVAVFSFVAFSKVDSSLKVNSAFYTNNIIDKTPVNGQFLLMNVSVKNNGKDTITVSNDQFTPILNGKPVDKYSVFTGDGTDLPKQVQIPGGQSKDIWVIFDIGDQKPDAVEYHGPISWASTYKTNTSINSISLNIPFNGMNLSLNMLFDMSGEAMGISFNMTANGTTNSIYEQTSDPNLMKEITNSIGTSTGTVGGQTNNQTSNTTTTGIINLKTGLYTNGSFTSTLPANLTKKGDTATVDNSTYTIVGSEIINILGHKLDCWKVDGVTESEGQKLKATMFFDKTTKIPVKLVINNQTITVSGVNMQVVGSGELISTNAPLIGIA